MSIRIHRNGPHWRSVVDTLWMFDPAGISSVHREAPEEYDSIAMALYIHLTKQTPDEAIDDWLRDELDSHWGAPFGPRELEPLLIELHSAWVRAGTEVSNQGSKSLP